jgi:hypothetical protein
MHFLILCLFLAFYSNTFNCRLFHSESKTSELLFSDRVLFFGEFKNPGLLHEVYRCMRPGVYVAFYKL